MLKNKICRKGRINSTSHREGLHNETLNHVNDPNSSVSYRGPIYISLSPRAQLSVVQGLVWYNTALVWLCPTQETLVKVKESMWAEPCKTKKVRTQRILENRDSKDSNKTSVEVQPKDQGATEDNPFLLTDNGLAKKGSAATSAKGGWA